MLGSLAGLVLSIVAGWGLLAGRGVFAATALPDHPLVLAPSAILTTFLVGTGSTFIAAVIPALRAGRLDPITVLQNAPLHDARPRRYGARLACALVLAGAGAGLIWRGVQSGFDGLVWTFGGAAVLFGGLILAAPLAVGRITVIVGWIPARLFGATGRLALGQARHRPRRLAATTSALMVGVGVLATMSAARPTPAAAAADVQPQVVAQLHLLDLKCLYENDNYGSDEPYININGQRVWSGSNVDRGNVELVHLRFDFDEVVTVSLWEDDGGVTGGDDDHMGTWHIFAAEVGSGIMTLESQESGGIYELRYEVV